MLAHVDHGKSALSDSLISANGIISSRSAGKVCHCLTNLFLEPRVMVSRLANIQLGFAMCLTFVLLRLDIWIPEKTSSAAALQ